MKSILYKVAAAAIVTFGASAASAATLTINPLAAGQAGTIPSGSAVNDFLDQKGAVFSLPTTGLDGFFGSNISGTGPLYVYEFYGSEAGYRNTFFIDNSLVFDDLGNTAGSGVFGVGAAPIATFQSASLNFEFRTSGNGTVANNSGTNPGIPGQGVEVMNFFASFGDTSTTGNGLWLFLDDGGADENDNHDDFVVRITAVPLPAAAWMLIAGLGGLGFLGRKRARA